MAFMDSFLNNVQVAVGGFHTPEVLKRNDEDIQKQIAYLEQNPTEENKKKLASFKKGAQGEANVLFQLEHSGIGMYILHGIHVEDAQIDFVVVTRGWVYFIESKNWSGTWKVQKDGTIIIQNGKYKRSHESPFAQNQRHMEAVKQRWRKKNSKVTTMLFSSLFEKNWYKPLVVVSNYESVIDLKYASKYDKEHIVRADQLATFIKNDLKTYGGREPFSTKKEMRAIADGFLKAEKEYQESKAQEKEQKREAKEPPINSYDYQQSQQKFKRNLQSFRKYQGDKEGRSQYDILTDREIQIILNHNYSDPNELDKVTISQSKKDRYGKVIIAAYKNAFKE